MKTDEVKKAESILIGELQKGKDSGENEGYISFRQLKKKMKEKLNK